MGSYKVGEPIFPEICGELAFFEFPNDYIAELTKKFSATMVSLEYPSYEESSLHNLVEGFGTDCWLIDEYGIMVAPHPTSYIMRRFMS